MATTPPPVVVLDDAGKSKHLRFKGVVGGGSLEVTVADLRDANSRDRRYRVGSDVPAITNVPAPPLKARATPPRAKKKNRRG